MKRTARLLGLPALVLCAALPSASAPLRIATPSVPIARQVDALLKHRLRPEPLPVDLPNPFAPPGPARREITSTPAERVPAAPAPAPIEDELARLPTNAEVLADCARRLRIGGLITLKDQLQLVINDAPRKEGDSFLIQRNTNRLQLTVVRIRADHVVLRYLDAEQTVPF